MYGQANDILKNYRRESKCDALCILSLNGLLEVNSRSFGRKFNFELTKLLNMNVENFIFANEHLDNDYECFQRNDKT